MANVIQETAVDLNNNVNTNVNMMTMLMEDYDDVEGGDSSMMLMMNVPGDSNDADNAIMAMDDDVCPTMTECEEDRKLLEAFLNETDIDLIENPTGNDTTGGGIGIGIGGIVANGGNGRNVRQVSDGTNSQATVATTTTTTHTPTPPPVVTTLLTGRPPIQLYLSCNPDHLSEYQCLIRKNIELFEATDVDVRSRIKGRNKPIVLGQVGIRCMYCRHVDPQLRGRGAMYYPHKLSGIYQAAQILSQGHLMNDDRAVCAYVPESLKGELKRLKAVKSDMTTAGKDYWAATAKALGVYEDEYGLRFEERLGMVRHH